MFEERAYLYRRKSGIGEGDLVSHTDPLPLAREGRNEFEMETVQVLLGDIYVLATNVTATLREER